MSIFISRTVTASNLEKLSSSAALPLITLSIVYEFLFKVDDGIIFMPKSGTKPF